MCIAGPMVKLSPRRRRAAFSLVSRCIKSLSIEALARLRNRRLSFIDARLRLSRPKVYFVSSSLGSLTSRRSLSLPPRTTKCEKPPQTFFFLPSLLPNGKPFIRDAVALNGFSRHPGAGSAGAATSLAFDCFRRWRSPSWVDGERRGLLVQLCPQSHMGNTREQL